MGPTFTSYWDVRGVYTMVIHGTHLVLHHLSFHHTHLFICTIVTNMIFICTCRAYGSWLGFFYYYVDIGLMESLWGYYLTISTYLVIGCSGVYSWPSYVLWTFFIISSINVRLSYCFFMGITIDILPSSDSCWVKTIKLVTIGKYFYLGYLLCISFPFMLRTLFIISFYVIFTCIIFRARLAKKYWVLYGLILILQFFIFFLIQILIRVTCSSYTTILD